MGLRTLEGRQGSKAAESKARGIAGGRGGDVDVQYKLDDPSAETMVIFTIDGNTGAGNTRFLESFSP